MNRTLSIVIPTYFNEGSIPALHAELMDIESELGKKQIDVELIIVDDGSRDNTWLELLKIKDKRPATKLIRLTRNFGAAHCSKTGLTFASGDCFTILAADLQEPPRLILQMVDLWNEGKKFVVCRRVKRNDPIHTVLFASIYNFLIRWFVIRDYPRGGYDLALMDKQLLPYVQNSSKNINPPLYHYWLGFAPTVIEYHKQPRLHGKSRWSFRKKVILFLDSMLGFSIAPLRFISSIGIVTSIGSFAYGLHVAINAVLGRIEVQGFPTLVALLTFLLGLVLFTLGIIGEYLWRIFDEVNHKPEAVIDEIL